MVKQEMTKKTTPQWVKEIKADKNIEMIGKIPTKKQQKEVVKELYNHFQTWNMYHFKTYQIAFYSKKVEQLKHISDDLKLGLKNWLDAQRDNWLSKGLKASIKERKEQKKTQKKSSPKKSSKKSSSTKETKGTVVTDSTGNKFLLVDGKALPIEG